MSKPNVVFIGQPPFLPYPTPATFHVSTLEGAVVDVLGGQSEG